MQLCSVIRAIFCAVVTGHFIYVHRGYFFFRLLPIHVRSSSRSRPFISLNYHFVSLNLWSIWLIWISFFSAICTTMQMMYHVYRLIFAFIWINLGFIFGERVNWIVRTEMKKITAQMPASPQKHSQLWIMEAQRTCLGADKLKRMDHFSSVQTFSK